MRKILALLLAPALILSACDTGGIASAGSLPASPAPLAKTTIDDTALDGAWRAFDLALDAINLLTDQGIIKPGTAKAKTIAAGIRKVSAALTAAESFAAAGSTTSYAQAVLEAKAGIDELRTALKG